jgi:beta-galactosidase
MIRLNIIFRDKVFIWQKMQLKSFIYRLFLISVLITNQLMTSAQNLPQLGAEIYLEPGQAPQQVDHWVKVLSESKMSVARVFMMWNYLEPKPGVWDFHLYDTLFESAQKYGVKITATLVPNSPPFHWGPPFFYRTHDMRMFAKKEYRENSKNYIKKVVERYKDNPALDSWWLFNEPSGNAHPDEFALEEFRKWLEEKYITIDLMNISWQSYFQSFEDICYNEGWLASGWAWPVAFYDWRNFWHTHVNNQIVWLGNEVRKYDSIHPFHTNPPGIWNAMTHYDVPAMKKTVNTLGTSLHPSWAFSFIPENKFALTVSYENNLLYGITQDMPYWISELQAGNNSQGIKPIGLSSQTIAQWVWTSIGSGAKRVIFWLLNPRMQGNESNEWALIDFQQQPSERLHKIKEIVNILEENQTDFANAKPFASAISIILSNQTLLMQERKQNRFTDLDAGKALAHQKASMACYNALMQQGIPVQLKQISEFDWGTNKTNQVAILAHVISLSKEEIEGIKIFVRNGNKLIVTGLTGLFDENEKSWLVNRDFPLAEVFGGSIQEIFIEHDHFNIYLDGYKEPFPSQFWYAQILPGTGKVVGSHNKKPIALRNQQGSVLWMPTMVDVGAWAVNSLPLGDLLKNEAGDQLKDLPFRFNTFHESCFMHTLSIPGGYITVVVNDNSTKEEIEITSSKDLKSKVLYGKGWDSISNVLTLEPGETVVLKWN